MLDVVSLGQVQLQNHIRRNMARATLKFELDSRLAPLQRLMSDLIKPVKLGFGLSYSVSNIS